jgi:hypothetical protein
MMFFTSLFVVFNNIMKGESSSKSCQVLRLDLQVRRTASRRAWQGARREREAVDETRETIRPAIALA